MSIDILREQAYRLSERLSWLGVGPDIPAMTAIELEALIRFLRRIAGE